MISPVSTQEQSSRMTAYRFRIKFDPDPTSLWRDIVVGADRTITELQSAINPAVGLDQAISGSLERMRTTGTVLSNTSVRRNTTSHSVATHCCVPSGSRTLET